MEVGCDPHHTLAQSRNHPIPQPWALQPPPSKDSVQGELLSPSRLGTPRVSWSSSLLSRILGHSDFFLETKGHRASSPRGLTYLEGPALQSGLRDSTDFLLVQKRKLRPSGAGAKTPDSQAPGMPVPQPGSPSLKALLPRPLYPPCSSGKQVQNKTRDLA